MWKNQAGQQIALFAFDAVTGLPKSGDAANMVFYVNKDWAGPVAIASNAGVPTEIDAVNAKGKYRIALAQAETNADALEFTGKTITANIAIVPMRFDTMPLAGIRKNTGLNAFSVVMVDSITKARATGKVVSVTRSIDGAAFAGGTLSAPAEISATGVYAFNWAAADLNGDVIMLLATAVGCDDVLLEIRTTQ